VFLSEANKAFMAEDSVLPVYHSHPYRPGWTISCTSNGLTEVGTYDPPNDNLNPSADALLTAAMTNKRRGAGRAPIGCHYINAQNAYRVPATPNPFLARIWSSPGW
jgi:hypothetical protein